ncbi:MAG: hypothetical protein N2255_04990, partial [Kiritimatiellae bacterium]|nr:hypothetical protein [Kiritimatiellia bacterium]
MVLDKLHWRRTMFLCGWTVSLLFPHRGWTAPVGFAVAPAAVATSGGTKISFTVAGPTDVEVAIIDAEGKVVRSLAAGVLGGANPPPPPLKSGFRQELVWDGKGDWNVPVGTGPFKVRVRLGMGVKFGRMIGDSHYNFNETVCRGLAVDHRNGDLYVMGKKTRDAALYFLRVYDRQGRYLREIMPYAATIDAKSRGVFGCVEVPGSEFPAPINYHSLWPTFYPVTPRPQGVNDLAIKLMAVHPVEESVVLLAESFASLYRIRKTDGGVVTDTFAESLWSARRLAGSAAVGPVMGAFAPDGKTIYFAGYAAVPPKGEKSHPAWPNGRVYKAVLTSEGYETQPFADIPLPDDAPAPEVSWNVLGNKQALHGIAVDRGGRIYVCDAAGGKVHILSPEGKILGAVEVPAAYCVAVDEKRGVMYVLTRKNTGHGLWPKSLVKINGLDSRAKTVCALTFPERGGSTDPFLAGDFGGPEPQLWIAGCPQESSIVRIADRGDRFEVLEDLADRDKTSSGFACRLDVDREADLVYIHNGWAYILRYNGITGEYAGPLDKDGRPKPIVGSEFCIRRDGMIYLSGHDNPGGGYSGPWRRLTRNLTEVPLPDGRKQFADRYGKMGGGYFGNQGSFVTPDGHLYFNGMFVFRINAVWEVNPDGSPGRCPRLRDVFENHHTTTVKSEKLSETMVKAGFTGALIGWLQDQSGGVEVDQEGNIYVGVRILPRGYTLPEPLEQVARQHRHWAESIGSVIKVRPSGGGMVPDSLAPGEKYRIDKYWTYEFTVPEKLEEGIKLGYGQRLDWYNPPRTIHFEGGLIAYPLLAPFSNQCACQTPRFAVDDFGRVYICLLYTS